MDETIQFILNGEKRSLSVTPDRMLLWILRSDYGLTGTKHSCGQGFCAACTVLVDNAPVLSCQFPAREVNGKSVLTIEGLKKNGSLHPIQSAFLSHNALQCGYCTPGMILTALGLLLKNPQPTEKQIVEALEGNLCRCGCYNRIIQAVQTAGSMMHGGAR